MSTQYRVTAGSAEKYFKTDDEIRANLKGAAQTPWRIKDHITFSGDSAVAQALNQSPNRQQSRGCNTKTGQRFVCRKQSAFPTEIPREERRAAPKVEGCARRTPLTEKPVVDDKMPVPDGTDIVSGTTATTNFPFEIGGNPSDTPDGNGTLSKPALLHQPSEADNTSEASPEKPLLRTEAYLSQMARMELRRRSNRLSPARMAGRQIVSAAVGNEYENRVADIAQLQPQAAKIELVGNIIWDTAGTLHRGKQAVRYGAVELSKGTMSARQALRFGKNFAITEGKHNFGHLLKKTITLAGEDVSAFNPGASDFASAAPVTFKNAAVSTYHGVKAIRRVAAQPAYVWKAIKRLFSMPIKKVAFVLGIPLAALLLIVFATSMQGMTSTLTLTTLCANRIEDVQQLVTALNNYRDAALTTELYNAFRGDTDPNGNPYGYSTLTGKKSNNLTHGVTWAYANGISNDTAEIISMAAVYFQQDWPDSEAFADVAGSEEPFLAYCKALAAYGLDATAQESAPYSCLTYGGCVQGYHSEGELVEIKDYKQVTHVCQEGEDECGHYLGSGDSKRWEWSGGHGEGQSHEEWVQDGDHEAIVYFPVIFPEGANTSELSNLPDGTVPVSGAVAAGSTGGGLVLSDYNLYKGNFKDWFYKPGELTGSFSVMTGEGEDAITDTYEVTFQNATTVPWCPGELNDGQYGHYDLDVTLYLAGYDSYENPETAAPDGDSGGSGNLKALAKVADTGRLTRTVLKKNQHGETYTGNATAARFSKTVALPQGANGFSTWYTNDTDRDGNVAWAELLYKMDWEELYQITDGIKCKTIGRGLSSAELAEILAALGLEGDDARAQVAAIAIASQGKFGYTLGAKPSGGPGNVSVGAALDCSGFIRYCYWSVGLPFAALNTGDYGGAGDLAEISAGAIQPGDLRVVYSSGGVSGHVQMYIGSGSWAECCSGYGVSINMSNAWMESRPCHYFTYAGF